MFLLCFGLSYLSRIFPTSFMVSELVEAYAAQTTTERSLPMRWIAAAILALAGQVDIAAGAARQQTVDAPSSSDQIWIRPAGSNPVRCNSKLAASVDIIALMADPARWAGKCVAVKGYWNGPALFPDHKMDRGVAIYADEALSKTAPQRPRAYLAIGFAGSCTKFSRNVMIMGFCHVSDGPFISVAEMQRR